MKASSIVILPQDRLLLGVVRLVCAACAHDEATSSNLVDGSSSMLLESLDLAGLELNDRLDVITFILFE